MDVQCRYRRDIHIIAGVNNMAYVQKGYLGASAKCKNNDDKVVMGGYHDSLFRKSILPTY